MRALERIYLRGGLGKG